MRHTLLISFMVTLFFACSNNSDVKDIDYEQLYQKGLQALKKKRYLKAQENFNSVVLGASHTELGDDAQFYLAESYFLNKEYLLAIAEYEKLVRRMQFSPYVEKARYRICEAYVAKSPEYYHDQTYTRKSLEKLQEFLDDYPQSEHREEAQKTIIKLRNKLARKLYETGILYIKLEEYKSAKMAFSQVVEKYYDSDYFELAHFKIILCEIKLGELEEARDHFQQSKKYLEKIGQADTVAQWLESGKVYTKVTLE
jgi:outer membrane protein assembly factor BamD